MKTILYMAVTANGYIADLDDNVDWISTESWQSYQKLVATHKVAIIGRRTFELMKADEFVKGCHYYVLTSKTGLKTSGNVTVTDKSPTELLDQLEQEGVDSVCILGGSYLIAGFVYSNLITELFLDVEPFLIGDGIPLFAQETATISLKLLGTHMLNENTIQLHYQVV